MNMNSHFKKAVGYLIIFVGVCVSCVAVTPNQAEMPRNTTQDFPLVIDNTWVYQRTEYAGFNATEIMTTTQVVTETVIDIRTEGDNVVAIIKRDRSSERLISEDVNAFSPETVVSSSDYWLIINDGRVYYQEDRLDLAGLEDTGEIELVFPLEVKKKWYLNHKMAEANPNKTVDSMLRKVQKEEAVEVPAGCFEGCFFMEEVIGGSTFERWFCPGIGWVDRRSDHHGTPYGWREILLEYHLN